MTKNQVIRFLYKADGNTQKFEVYVFHTYSAIYSTITCHFRPILLNKSPPFFEQTAEKCIIFAEEKLHLSKIFKQA